MHDKILRLFTLANTGCCFLKALSSDRKDVLQLESIGVVMSKYNIEFIKLNTVRQNIGDEHVAVLLYLTGGRNGLDTYMGEEQGRLVYASNYSVFKAAGNETTDEQNKMMLMVIGDAVEQLLERAENEVAQTLLNLSVKFRLIRKPVPLTQKEAAAFFSDLSALKREEALK